MYKNASKYSQFPEKVRAPDAHHLNKKKEVDRNWGGGGKSKNGGQHINRH